MAGLAEYEVLINGQMHTMQLDEADAKRYDAKPVRTKQVAAPRNKQAKPANK